MAGPFLALTVTLDGGSSVLIEKGGGGESSYQHGMGDILFVFLFLGGSFRLGGRPEMNERDGWFVLSFLIFFSSHSFLS